MKGTTGCFLLVLHKTSYKNGKLIWVRFAVFEISSALPLLSEEFLTGPVVASREMPNTQVTPEFTDMTRFEFFRLKKMQLLDSFCQTWNNLQRHFCGTRAQFRPHCEGQLSSWTLCPVKKNLVDWTEILKSVIIAPKETILIVSTCFKSFLVIFVQ